MSAHRRGTELGRLAVVAALLPLALAFGCQRRASGGKSLAERTATPEGQLEKVMERLEFALEIARPPEGAAVVSQRSATHRLIAPSDANPAYEAEVTITTSMGLAPEKVEQIAGDAPAANGDAASVGGELPSEEAKAESERIVADAADTIVEKAKVSETKVYKLHFKDDRWELVDPPADKLTEVETLLFRSALGDG